MEEIHPDDNKITYMLNKHGISYKIINDVISIIKLCRNNKYKYLNIDYLTISTYILVKSHMLIDEEYIKKCCYMIITDNNDDYVFRTLYRYCLYVLECVNKF